MQPIFRDRRDAGTKLGQILQERFPEFDNVLVLALPRGGVPVAYPIAEAFSAPLDILLVRKLGVPGHEELALGAIAEGGARVTNDAVVRSFQLTDDQIAQVVADEQKELLRRGSLYREGEEREPLDGRNVILVDDGLATGASMLVAVRALRQEDPARIIVAVPVAPADTCEALRAEADDVVCAETPEKFMAVGAWYEDFTQTTDEEVRRLLADAREFSYPGR